MNAITRNHLADIHSADRHEVGAAYSSSVGPRGSRSTGPPGSGTGWLEGLSHKDDRVRSISAQLLCNLAKSNLEAEC